MTHDFSQKEIGIGHHRRDAKDGRQLIIVTDEDCLNPEREDIFCKIIIYHGGLIDNDELRIIFDRWFQREFHSHFWIPILI